VAGAKTGLLNFIVIGMLLTVVSASVVYHATPVIEEAEKVNKENAVAQFQRVIMLARAQWIWTRRGSTATPIRIISTRRETVPNCR